VKTKQIDPAIFIAGVVFWLGHVAGYKAGTSPNINLDVSPDERKAEDKSIQNLKTYARPFSSWWTM